MQLMLRHSYLLILLCVFTSAHARLEVCNHTDLVLMVAVGYDTSEDRVASEGWWRIYPGFCEVPVDVAMLRGNYYVHAESNPRSTMPADAFTWGEEAALCVELSDFRNTDARQCPAGKILINFNTVEKNWRNSNKVDIYYAKRGYDDTFQVKIAGVQRLLSVLGYDLDQVDGALNEQTVSILNQIGVTHGVFGFDFKRVFPLLEQLIAQQHKLDN